jgi:hypothetical protein
MRARPRQLRREVSAALTAHSFCPGVQSVDGPVGRLRVPYPWRVRGGQWVAGLVRPMRSRLKAKKGVSASFSDDPICGGLGKSLARVADSRIFVIEGAMSASTD